jgi:hypothetical protein
VIYEEQLFDILHKIHVEETGHGGRDIMVHKIKDMYGVGQYVNNIIINDDKETGINCICLKESGHNVLEDMCTV